MFLLRWIRRHPVLFIIAAVVAVPLGLAIEWWFWPSIPPDSSGEVDSAEIVLTEDTENPQAALRVTSRDKRLIDDLLAVLRSAERASEHKCANCGSIWIQRPDGDYYELGILPGHDPEYYEYRYGSRINRVKREPFLAALHAMGVDKIKLKPP